MIFVPDYLCEWHNYHDDVGDQIAIIVNDWLFNRISDSLYRKKRGNMWSAIPVALLCMIVNWSEGKQGSSPEGDEVL